jgi:2-oxoglutarate ferredoxin oxidoreductase subunit alpha
MSNLEIKELDDVVIRFAGDSGDGIQLIGTEFTRSTALSMNDLGTFPDYPAEIRAPAGTISGVSGFQIHFSSNKVFTPGDDCDVLVVMNAAALKKSIGNLKSGGILIANSDGFDVKNLKLAGYVDNSEPLSDPGLSKFTVHSIPITKLTREALKEFNLGTKEADRSKNMFVLGVLIWLYHRPIEPIENFINSKFAKKPDIANANLAVLRAGFNFGETAEIFASRFKVSKAKMPAGVYREITGNAATALGLVVASQKSGIPIFYGSYPITPASDILHDLAKLKNFDVITFQAEDEIAAVGSALGASFGGRLGVTASSGPGIDLKAETLGLAVMTELPLIVIDVQRAGPSTGMPTKTEQSDLLLALFGRHGEAPMPVLAPKNPADCFDIAYEAYRIALEFMTPVFILTDAFLANGAEPWKFPTFEELPAITSHSLIAPQENYKPYQRNENLVRQWAIPGIKGNEHRIGGIEKEDPTGNISYDPANHQRMIEKRQQKIDNVANTIPSAELEDQVETDTLIVSWGSTYGVIKTAIGQLKKEDINVAHLHLRYLNPLPHGVGDILKNYKTVILPENNSGQLAMILRSKFLVNIIPFPKIMGMPFTVNDIISKIKSTQEINHVN